MSGLTLSSLPSPQHAQEQPLAPAVATKEVVTYITTDDVGVERYFQELPSLNGRAIGDCQVASEGGRLAECIALGDVKLHG